MTSLREDRAKTLADARWRGPHGIGRFATEVLARIGDYTSIPESLPLLHPLETPWLTAAVHRLRPSVYFTPGFNPPLAARCPLIFAIHDLIHLKVPGETSTLKRLYYEAFLKPAARRAAAVLTVSEASRADILEWARIHPSRVVVAGNGVSQAFTADGPAHTGAGPYFFYAGNLKPHKNVPRMIEAFAMSRLAPDFRLCLTGSPGPDTLAHIDRLGLRARIGFLGTVTDAEMAAYYRGAMALVTPSLAEGFCLPALEAMACGCPVVASGKGAQREVLAGAGIYVDPQDVADIARGMHAATGSTARDHAIQAGLRRARDFSWDLTAARVKQTLAAAAHA